ncbi:ubiquitin-like-conjugating enzyme ATG10 [Citrus sinensis]|nr:ubiquitin-like-conjugating enzyme ATG10 [Citrus sinensis]
MDILAWDGTLSLSEFSLAAHTLADKWKRFNPSFPSWSWVACRKQPWFGSREVQNYDCDKHYYDFHVIYNASYRVPVLYFRAYCSGGQPLVLDEIEKGLPSCSAKALSESKWTFITHEEHPYLNRPWYKLHPCGTGEWMKLLFLGDTTQKKNGVAIELYLVAWFSVVGQVVGLSIPSEMLNDSNPL